MPEIENDKIKAWMMGNYAARQDDCKALSDVELMELDERYLKELALRAKRHLVDKSQTAT